jgi:hypothetical protein
LFGDHRFIAMVEFVEGVFIELERVEPGVDVTSSLAGERR